MQYLEKVKYLKGEKYLNIDPEIEHKLIGIKSKKESLFSELVGKVKGLKGKPTCYIKILINNEHRETTHEIDNDNSPIFNNKYDLYTTSSSLLVVVNLKIRTRK
jgi:hypothetical protein